MFEHDHSAARGLMSTRNIIVFEHNTALGNKPANELFGRVDCKRTTKGQRANFLIMRFSLMAKKLDENFKIVNV